MERIRKKNQQRKVGKESLSEKPAKKARERKVPLSELTATSKLKSRSRRKCSFSKAGAPLSLSHSTVCLCWFQRKPFRMPFSSFTPSGEYSYKPSHLLLSLTLLFLCSFGVEFLFL